MKAVAEGASQSSPSAAPLTPKRLYNARMSMDDILQVATAEFADKGLSGARIDEIAAATRTSKRMIYYHFGSKEGLYLAALEAAYKRVRVDETLLHLEDLEPEAALRKLVEFTFDHHQEHEDFIRLVMTENIHRAEFLRDSPSIQQLNSAVIDSIRALYRRGVSTGNFRHGIDPIDLHKSISALCFFEVSNRYTFSIIFKRDAMSKESLKARRGSVVDMVVRFVRNDDASGDSKLRKLSSTR